MEHDITIIINGETKTIENSVLSPAGPGKVGFYIPDTDEMFLLPSDQVISIIPARFRKDCEI